MTWAVFVIALSKWLSRSRIDGGSPTIRLHKQAASGSSFSAMCGNLASVIAGLMSGGWVTTYVLVIEAEVVLSRMLAMVSFEPPVALFWE